MAFGDIPRYVETQPMTERDVRSTWTSYNKRDETISVDGFNDLMLNQDALKTTLQIWGSGEALQKKIMAIYTALKTYGSVFYVPDYYRDNDPHIIVIRTPKYMEKNGYV